MQLRPLLSVPVRWLASRAGYRIVRQADYDLALYAELRYLREWSPQDVVFDVGANDGRTIHRIRRHLGPPRILAFEPVSETFDVLKRETAGYPAVEYVQLALGNEEGRREIYINENAAVNSLYEGWGSCEERETIAITTLDSFLAGHPVDRINLLKVDTEGHDLEVLKGAERTLSAGRVDIIMVETGFAAPGRPQPSLADFQDYLTPLGYYLHGIFNQCRMSLARRLGRATRPDSKAELLIYCDALFVRARC